MSLQGSKDLEPPVDFTLHCLLFWKHCGFKEMGMEPKEQWMLGSNQDRKRQDRTEYEGSRGSGPEDRIDSMQLTDTAARSRMNQSQDGGQWGHLPLFQQQEKCPRVGVRSIRNGCASRSIRASPDSPLLNLKGVRIKSPTQKPNLSPQPQGTQARTPSNWTPDTVESKRKSAPIRLAACRHLPPASFCSEKWSSPPQTWPCSWVERQMPCAGILDQFSREGQRYACPFCTADFVLLTKAQDG